MGDYVQLAGKHSQYANGTAYPINPFVYYIFAQADVYKRLGGFYAGWGQ